MKKKTVGLSCLLGMFLLCLTLGQNVVKAAEPVPRTINVQGQSEFTVVPDRASIEIGIETTGTTAQKAVQSNASVMTAVQNALYGLGLTQNDLKTSSYNFYPVYDKDNNQNISFYKAENTIVVTTGNTAQIGTVIDTAIKSGASNVNSVTFNLKDEEKYKDSALKLAIQDAKRKAKIIADELGKSVVNVVSADEGNVYVENYVPPAITMKAMVADMGTPTPINARNLNVSAKINITFEIN